MGEQHGRRQSDDEGGVFTFDLSRRTEQHRGSGTHHAVHDGRSDVNGGIDVRREAGGFALCRSCRDQLPMGAAIGLPGHEPGVHVQGTTQQTTRCTQQDQRRDVHGLPRVTTLTPGCEFPDIRRA
ncbi:hypothetical protein ABZ446_27470 [Streptomyces sp. NPDC005813]|uniref:hypothetical protein n=1 Tax=Streptomyces sp. NPDC005813 TaxID=3155592 RepID=UPI0033FAC6E7